MGTCAVKQLEVDGRTILLVEDNDMVRLMAKALLLDFGFNVIEAEGPAQALQQKVAFILCSG